MLSSVQGRVYSAVRRKASSPSAPGAPGLESETWEAESCSSSRIAPSVVSIPISTCLQGILFAVNAFR